MARDTRHRLLQAALLVVQQQGYSSASVDDIAHAAGLTKGAIYGQFDSKRGILIALIGEWEEIVLASLADWPGSIPSGSSLPGAAAAALESEMVLEFWRQALDDGAVAQCLQGAYGRIRRGVVVRLAASCEKAQAEETGDSMIQMHDGMAALRILRRAGQEERPDPSASPSDSGSMVNARLPLGN